MIHDIAMRRLRLIPLTRGGGLSNKQKIVVLAELSRLGIRIATPSFLDDAAPMSPREHATTMATLAQMRGGDVTYVPLFRGFPENVPEDGAYFAKRVLGYLAHVYAPSTATRTLDTGVAVPSWLFTLSEFGADPITQFQDRDLYEQGAAEQGNRDSDTHTEWLDYAFTWADQLHQPLWAWLTHGLYSATPIKQAWHADLKLVLAHCGVSELDFGRITQKENQALVLRLLWTDGREAEACRLARTPTDILRLFAALTDTDVSLARPIRFPKLSRGQRRAILGALERAPRLQEDLQRRRALWLKIGRSLHVGEYAKFFPKTAAAFDRLRNGRIETFASVTERLLTHAATGPVLRHLATRPGVLARSVHRLLRRYPQNSAQIADAFATVASSMTAKNLLVLDSYFATINDAPRRTIINRKGAIHVLPNNARWALSATQIDQMCHLIEKTLQALLRQRESWHNQTAWIDPRLASYTVPLGQRSSSDGLINYGRGTRIPVDMARVLRLFVYWRQQHQQTDLDLSLIQFDKDFAYRGHVSYTNLQDAGIVHSGDIQSAPHGAAEFIDVTLEEIPREVRYLAPQVYRYAGEAFADMASLAGWMMRDNVDSAYQSFDIKTVANQFALSGRSSYCLPLIVDLQEREIILADLYMGNVPAGNRVEGAKNTISLAAREVAQFCHTRPTLLRLAQLHCQARGAKIIPRGRADISFGLDAACTYDMRDTNRVLSLLL